LEVMLVLLDRYMDRKLCRFNPAETPAPF
jgi:hypothetical protein